MARSDFIEVSVSNKKPIEFGVEKSGGGSGGNYATLTNKPQINGVTLIGNKTSKELKVQDEMDEISEQEIDIILYGGM